MLFFKLFSTIRKEREGREYMGVREATKRDISEITELKIRTWRGAYQGLIDSVYLEEMDQELLEKNLAEHFQDNRRIVYEENGKIVGFCVYGQRQQVQEGLPEYDAEICALYVDMDYHKKGIGRSLMEYAKRDLKRMGKSKFLIWCLKDNLVARAFYTKMGGEAIARKWLYLNEEGYEEIAYGYEIKPRYGFFGGSFNPPTMAHEKLAVEIAKEFELDKVVFVPMGDSYEKPNLAREEERYEMLKRVCNNHPMLEVSDMEFGKKLTAIEAFELIKTTYPEVEPYFIMGADNFEKIVTWNEAEKLVKEYRYIILKRNDIDISKIIEEQELLKSNQSHFQYSMKQKEREDSSSQIREGLRKGKDIKKKIRKSVMEYILQNHLYDTKEG